MKSRAVMQTGSSGSPCGNNWREALPENLAPFPDEGIYPREPSFLIFSAPIPTPPMFLPAKNTSSTSATQINPPRANPPTRKLMIFYPLFNFPCQCPNQTQSHIRPPPFNSHHAKRHIWRHRLSVDRPLF